MSQPESDPFKTVLIQHFQRELFKMGHPVLNHEINSQGNLENIQEAVQFDSEKGKDYKILDRE